MMDRANNPAVATNVFVIPTIAGNFTNWPLPQSKIFPPVVIVNLQRNF